MGQVKKEQIIQILKQCYDPELPVDLWNLGLIYDIQIQESYDENKSDVNITMSLTTPGCSMGQDMAQDIKTKLESMDEVNQAFVEVTFDPPWNPEMISDEARKKLGVGVLVVLSFQFFSRLTSRPTVPCFIWNGSVPSCPIPGFSNSHQMQVFVHSIHLETHFLLELSVFVQHQPSIMVSVSQAVWLHYREFICLSWITFGMGGPTMATKRDRVDQFLLLKMVRPDTIRPRTKFFVTNYHPNRANNTHHDSIGKRV